MYARIKIPKSHDELVERVAEGIILSRARKYGKDKYNGKGKVLGTMRMGGWVDWWD